ncbi:MAG: hypothetical protein LIP01_08280 [Tannerellaceae bacterium]|nr:hypothetical protein [Tannerellaceae bacterium]
MKKLFFIGLILTGMISCSNGSSTKQSESDTETVAVQTIVYELDELLKVADQLLDQNVAVKGYVTHTCKHAGKRCFIVGESQKTSFRVEAKGEIGGFNRELVGSELAITGILKERRLTKEYIDQMEEQVNKKAEEDGSAESCQAELNNISEMRSWMAENGKEFYSIYYMDGLNYEVIE